MAGTAEDDAAGHSKPRRLWQRASWTRLRALQLGLTAIIVAVAAVVTVLLVTHNSPARPRAAAGSAYAHGGIPAPTGPSANRAQVPVSDQSLGTPGTAKVAESAGPISVPRALIKPVRAWAAGGGGKKLNDVAQQVGSVLQMGGIRQFVAMRSGCVLLAADVQAAQSGPPIPDPGMQRLYTKAIDSIAAGAATCQRAIDVQNADESVQTHENAVLLKRCERQLSAGANGVFEATAEFAILARNH